ncbi:MAG: ABC transporter substrate-binding protein [Hyphomicrobiaceae bacterium]|nr:ABC transporter substrate-binding protein [Hyphomicrobiaceae bacterium]
MRLGLVCASALALLLSAGPSVADKSPVKIGVLNDQSGLYADLSGLGSVEAARMAIEDFGGKLFGAPIELVHADHKNRADLASTIAREWFDNSKVDAIADLTASSVALAVQELARERSKFAIHTSGATSRLTGDACSPTGVHWAYDTYALANGTARALVAEGQDTWFFLTADYAFGHSLEKDTGAMVEKMGGKVLGAVRHPLDNQDFSSYLMQAQASKSKMIGLANASSDTLNAIRQAKEFGLVSMGQRLAALLLFITDIHAVGLEAAQELVLTTGFYWDRDEKTRAWSERFNKRRGHMPTMIQAGTYSAILHFLKAVEAAGTKEPKAVMEKMRAMRVDDFFGNGGYLREDGRMVHDMYLVRVKKPGQSKGPWDYFEVIRTIPGDEAFRPMKDGGCKYVKN